jgi:hypothetical protein
VPGLLLWILLGLIPAQIVSGTPIGTGQFVHGRLPSTQAAGGPRRTSTLDRPPPSAYLSGQMGHPVPLHAAPDFSTSPAPFHLQQSAITSSSTLQTFAASPSTSLANLSFTQPGCIPRPLAYSSIYRCVNGALASPLRPRRVRCCLPFCYVCVFIRGSVCMPSCMHASCCMWLVGYCAASRGQGRDVPVCGI